MENKNNDLTAFIKEMVRKSLEEMLPPDEIMSPEEEQRFADQRRQIKGNVVNPTVKRT
jgi:hypothetical protein